MKFEKLKDKIGDEWYNVLKNRINDSIYDEIYNAAMDYKNVKCYPEPQDIFRAFKETPYSNVKVVILGQDPYHNGNATGLAFDCKVQLSPSMYSIQDAYDDYDRTHFDMDIMEGNISRWTKQGVFLFNTALTVQKGKPNSHKKYWDNFTKEVIIAVNKKETPVVFLLWGNQAQEYSYLIDNPLHHILIAEHPVACRYQGRKWNHGDFFSKTNELLNEKIKW